MGGEEDDDEDEDEATGGGVAAGRASQQTVEASAGAVGAAGGRAAAEAEEGEDEETLAEHGRLFVGDLPFAEHGEDGAQHRPTLLIRDRIWLEVVRLGFESPQSHNNHLLALYSGYNAIWQYIRSERPKRQNTAGRSACSAALI